ncbi:MAG: hypothetical protein R6U39_03070 [Candidatus Aegiribacteria sp.]
MKTRVRLEISWLNQPGRIGSRTGSHADGFRGTPAVAGVAVVAEGPPSAYLSVKNAVNMVRDTFAEGVAYGAGDVLKDCMDGLAVSPGESPSLSIAAAAVLDGDVRVYSAGSCGAFLCGKGLEDSLAVELEKGTVMDVDLQPGQSVVLVTGGLRGLAGTPSAAGLARGCRNNLDKCLEEMVAGTRVRFKGSGGSAAAVRCCRSDGILKGISARRILYALLVILAGLTAAAVLCRNEAAVTPENRAQDPLPSGETVLPLERN